MSVETAGDVGVGVACDLGHQDSVAVVGQEQTVMACCAEAESVLPIFELVYPREPRPREAI